MGVFPLTFGKLSVSLGTSQIAGLQDKVKKVEKAKVVKDRLFSFLGGNIKICLQNTGKVDFE